MATAAQKRAAQSNIKKAQAAWKGMSKRQHSLAQPEGRARARPGTKGGGRFFRIVVRPKGEFSSFRVQDVGRTGHIERLAGRRKSGSWDTQAWLVSKDIAHVSRDKLIIDDKKSRAALKQIRGPIVREKADVFLAKPRKNVPEQAKPTPAMKKARQRNIKKAQAARWK